MQVPGARPWLAGLVSSQLRSDSLRPDLTGCHGQVLDISADGREATLYDGEHTIRTVLSTGALRELEPTAGAGGSARLLHGRTVAPVDAVLVPDVLASPAAVTLVLRRLSVFANSIAHPPILRPPRVADHPDVRRALRALVARHIAECAAPDEAAPRRAEGGREGRGVKGSEESDEEMEDVNDERSPTSGRTPHFSMPPAAIYLEEVFIPPPRAATAPAPPLRIPPTRPHASGSTNGASKPPPPTPKTPPAVPVNGVTRPAGSSGRKPHPDDDERSTVTIPSRAASPRPRSPTALLSPPPASALAKDAAEPSTLDSAERINPGQPMPSNSLPELPMTQHDAGAASESDDEQSARARAEDEESELLAPTISTPSGGPSQASRPSQASGRSGPSQGSQTIAPFALSRSPIISTASPVAPAGAPAGAQAAGVGGRAGTPRAGAAGSPGALASPKVPETPVGASPAQGNEGGYSPVAKQRSPTLPTGAAQVDATLTPEKPSRAHATQTVDFWQSPIAKPRSPPPTSAKASPASKVEVPASDQTAEDAMDVDVGAASVARKSRRLTVSPKEARAAASPKVNASDTVAHAAEENAGSAPAAKDAGQSPSVGAPCKQEAEIYSPAAEDGSPAAIAGPPASRAEALAMEASTEEAPEPKEATPIAPPRAFPRAPTELIPRPDPSQSLGIVAGAAPAHQPDKLSPVQSKSPRKPRLSKKRVAQSDAPGGGLLSDSALARSVAKQVRWRMFADNYLERMAREQPVAFEFADESLMRHIAEAERVAREEAGEPPARTETAHTTGRGDDGVADEMDVDARKERMAALVPESAPF